MVTAAFRPSGEKGRGLTLLSSATPVCVYMHFCVRGGGALCIWPTHLVKQLHRCVRWIFVYGCMVIVNSGHASGLKKGISLLPFVAGRVYLDREGIFLKPMVVDIVGMLEKDLSEVASVTTVIWFDTHIATHAHTHPHFHKYSGGCRRRVRVSHSFTLNYGPGACRIPSPLTHGLVDPLRPCHEPRLTYSPHALWRAAHSPDTLKVKCFEYI